MRPNARRTAVGGTWAGPGGNALLVAVAAPAVDGKANAAVVAAVAAAFGVRPRQVDLVTGERSRDKVLDVSGDEAEVAARLEELLV